MAHVDLPEDLELHAVFPNDKRQSGTGSTKTEPIDSVYMLYRRDQYAAALELLGALPKRDSIFYNQHRSTYHFVSGIVSMQVGQYEQAKASLMRFWTAIMWIRPNGYGPCVCLKLEKNTLPAIDAFRTLSNSSNPKSKIAKEILEALLLQQDVVN